MALNEMEEEHRRYEEAGRTRRRHLTDAALQVPIKALPHEEPLRLPADAPVAEAIRLSDILGRFPGIDLAKNAVGIFGECARLDDVVQDSDRVEIYRPLIADPKEARRVARGRRKGLNNRKPNR